jgi:hypothetical protein
LQEEEKGNKKPPPYQHGGDMLIKATVRHLIPIKGRAGVDEFNILLNKINHIKRLLEIRYD